MDPERRRRLVALGDWHREWADKQDTAAAFDPSGRPPGSDYNQHHVDVDATGPAQDEYHTKARKIMGIDS
ncbi:hypothetical protein [Micromonospora inyonensis]|nr:hypothetical protein [Micromonospora inyonensis]